MKLILSGGGDTNDTKALDDLFQSLIKPKQKILYLPVAWTAGNFAECKKWFSKTFTNFAMWTDLTSKTYEDLSEYGAIYLGGGNTFSLLSNFRSTQFDKLLLQFIKSDRPVYGGSAGAIIFGKSIETSTLGKDHDDNSIHLTDLRGMNLINNRSIHCHYEPYQDEEIVDYVKKSNSDVIALAEKTGLFITDEKIKVIGTIPAYIFSPDGKNIYLPTS